MKKLFLYGTFAIGLGYVIFNSSLTTAQNYQKNPPALKLADPMPSNLFVELAKAINPAVVNISTSVIPKGRTYRDPMMEMLEQFYGFRQQPQPQNNKPQRMGLGTGFIIREDGLILTNNHVIDGADLIEVQLTEKSEKQYKAEVIGRDARTDIALIKIKADVKLTAAALGSSTDTEVGEWVAAFGNPYGHGHTMTKGIISSKGRSLEEINKLPLLQTDASINPGNSGGPLVNSKGYVIGVNSAIDARAQGIGFAIPIDEVKKILPQLEQRGSIRKGFLGITPADIDDQTAQQLGLDEYRGAVVLGFSQGPAKKAGIKVYDIILEFNDKKIRNSRDLIDAVADTEPGKKVKMRILRGDKKINLDITVAERPDDNQLQTLNSDDGSEGNTKSPIGLEAPFKLGFYVSDINDQLKEKYNLNPELTYPVVTSVEKGSLASRIGLVAGDIILAVNSTKESTSAQKVIGAFKKGSNTLRIGRARGITTIMFEIK